MKRSIFKTALIFILLILIISGCNSSTKSKINPTEGEELINETDSFDNTKLKDQVVKVIIKLNESKDIVQLLNEVGASYIVDLTVPVEKAEKVISQNQMSFFWGIYVFDMFYAKTYNRSDQLLKLTDLEYKLKMNLGLGDELAKLENYNERIKQNKGNKDSIDFIIDESSETWFKDMSSNHLNVLIYSFIGNNTEAMYILTQLTLLASDNTKLIEIINEQNTQISNLFSLLQLVSEDENIKPYYEDLTLVVNIFKENQIITVKELNEIAPIIERVRNNMIN